MSIVVTSDRFVHHRESAGLVGGPWSRVIRETREPCRRPRRMARFGAEVRTRYASLSVWSDPSGSRGASLRARTVRPSSAPDALGTNLGTKLGETAEIGRNEWPVQSTADS